MKSSYTFLCLTADEERAVNQIRPWYVYEKICAVKRRFVVVFDDRVRGLKYEIGILLRQYVKTAVIMARDAKALCRWRVLTELRKKWYCASVRHQHLANYNVA